MKCLSTNNIEYLCEALLNKGVIAVPTETVYGFSTMVCQESVLKLNLIKNRCPDKGFILISGVFDHFLPFIDASKINGHDMNKISSTHPRPITWIVPAKKKIPWLMGKHDNIAIRVTNNDVLKKITFKLNQPVITTSINVSGKPPLNEVSDVLNSFSEKIDGIYCGDQIIPKRKPSVIIDLLENRTIRS